MTQAEELRRTVNPLVPWLSVLGAALLAGGVFCPAVVPPAGEARAYRDFAWSDGNVVLGAAAAAFVLTWVFRWYRGLFAAGGVALFMIGATALKVPRSDVAGATLSWGWLPLTAGAVLLLAAALVAEKGRPREEPEAAPLDEDMVEGD
jgi:hypothetical protein